MWYDAHAYARQKETRLSQMGGEQMIKIEIHDRDDLENLIDVIREIYLVKDLIDGKQTKLEDFYAS
jgi:hypothetical protein